MIFNFKLFENTETEKRTLVNTLDSDYIDKYFRDNYGIVEDNICYYVDIFDFVDDDDYRSDYIDDRVGCAEIDEFEIEDYANYIERHLSDKPEIQKYLKLRAEKLGYSLENDFYYEIIFKKASKKKLIDLIKNEDAEEDFIRKYYEDIYEDSSAEELLSEIYGEQDLKENAYKYLQNYVSYSELENSFYENADDDFKSEFVREEIYRDIELQKKLLKMDPKNAIPLFDIMENDEDTIGNTYFFQNKYMKEILKQLDPDKDLLFAAKKLKELIDKFGLADGIDIKYKDYMFYSDVEKYNL